MSKRTWTVWVVGGLASFAILEKIGYEQNETLTSQITRWRDSHPLARPLLAAALGATAGALFDHLLHHEPPPTLDHVREAGW